METLINIHSMVDRILIIEPKTIIMAKIWVIKVNKNYFSKYFIVLMPTKIIFLRTESLFW